MGENNIGEIGIGAIGLGGRLMGVIERTLPRLNNARVVAICDPDHARAKARADALGLDGPTFYDDPASLVKDPRLQWVFIGTPNSQHSEQTIMALDAGKHVFCEKPLCISIQECDRLQRAAARSKGRLAVGFVLRYSPHYQTIKRLLDEGTCGKIISFEFNETLSFNHGGYILSDWRRLRKHAGTALLEKCCHDIDMVCWLIGSKPVRVASFGGLAFFMPDNAHHMDRLGTDDKGRRAYQTWPSTTGLDPFTSDKDTEDHQVVIFEFENGTKATFHMNFHSGIPERRMYFCGTEGSLRADVIAGKIQIARVGFDEVVKDVTSGVAGNHGGGDDVLANGLANMINDGAPPRASLVEGIVSTATTLAIDEAMRESKVVNLRPIWRQLGL